MEKMIEYIFDMIIMNDIRKNDNDGKVTKCIELLSSKYDIRPIKGLELLYDLAKTINGDFNSISIDEEMFTKIFNKQE